MRKLYVYLFTALVLFISAANTVSAQNYIYTTSAGNAIVPGTVLVPLTQDDDFVANVALPFGYNAYGTVYNSVNVSTNGNLQFTTTNNQWANSCALPDATLGVAFMPHWDDLYLIPPPATYGIYTSVSGVAPNRIFNIEWRGELFAPVGSTVNFEARLFEGLQRVDFIYGTVFNNGSGATVAVQSAPLALQTTFSCNTASLSSGLGISFVPAVICSGTPAPGTITGPASPVCSGSSVTLNSSGSSSGAGINYQWQSSAVSGGPYTDIPGANGASYTFSPTAPGPGVATTYYSLKVTCTGSGLSANTPQFTLGVDKPIHTNVNTNVFVGCAPGTVQISGFTQSSFGGSYINSITGPGTIVNNMPSDLGPLALFSFTVTNLPAGVHTFTITSNDGFCSVSTPVQVTINGQVIVNQSPASICPGGVQTVSVSTAGSGSNPSFSVSGTNAIPATGTGATTGSPSSIYPQSIAVSGLPGAGATVSSVTLNGVTHTFPSDIDIVLVSPTGQSVILMSDMGGFAAPAAPVNLTLSDGAAGTIPTPLATGTYKPSNTVGGIGVEPDNWPAPGPGAVAQPTPTLSTFNGNFNGTWNLFVVDDGGLDVGQLTGWSITFNVPFVATTAVFSPVTGLFLNAGLSTPYAGTAVTTVFASPAATTPYTATNPVCPGAPVPFTVTVNPVTNISAHPVTVANTCAGSSISYLVTATGAGVLTYQWQVNTGAGFTNLANGGSYSNVTTNTLTINPVAASMNGYLYRCVVTGGCGILNSNAATLNVDQITRGSSSATTTSNCFPVTYTISGTALNGSAGNYTHTLTGSGTIVQNPSTGPNNNTGNFTVTGLAGGNYTFILTSTDALGCSVVSPIAVTVNPGPVVTITPPAPVICRNVITQLTANVALIGQQTFISGGPVLIPAGSPGVDIGNASPYPSVITLSGLPTSGATVKSVKINGFLHSFPDDVDIVLVPPTGPPVILMSDAGGATPAGGLDYTFDDGAAATMADNTFNNSGTYQCTNYGTPDNFPAPGPGSLSQATPTLASIGSINPNGDWKLYIVDDAAGNFGLITNWSFTLNLTLSSPVVFSPTTNLFTDAAATIPYTGTLVNTVYTQLTANATYTATATTAAGCSGSATVNVTVNQPPVITAQPVPASQIVCPGTIVTYSVAATGTGITYQWRRNTVPLVDGPQITGATGTTLTINNVTTANSGTYDVVVSGVCTPAATSNSVNLTVGAPPVISPQPANAIVCEGANPTFSVGVSGTPGAPFFYQWQVSTDGGVTYNNAAGPANPNISTYGLFNVTLAMNGYRYRVLVSNSCGLITTSNAAILTVNAKPPVTATALPATICLSDTLLNLSGSPVGGSWSGIGVSGFNFVPSATAVGTYNLTYSYTNTLGCTNTASIIAKVIDCPERIRLLNNNGVILYPNPNNGIFYLRINTTLYNYLGMRVYNELGQLVSFKTYNGLVYNRVVQVDLRRLPAGVYTVRLFYEDGARTDQKGFQVIIGGH